MHGCLCLCFCVFVFVVSRDKKCKMQENQDSEIVGIKYKNRLQKNSPWGHWNFLFTQSFRSHYGPGVDSTSNTNEYKRSSLGGKDGRSVGLTTCHLHVPIVGLSRENFTFTSHRGGPTSILGRFMWDLWRIK